MKRIIIFLFAIVVSLLLVSCAKTPVEKADEYILEINEEFFEDCSWSSRITRFNGEQIYEVSAYIPYFSSTIFKFDSLERYVIEGIAQKVYPELERILDGDNTIEHIYIFFHYENGTTSRYACGDGQIINFAD